MRRIWIWLGLVALWGCDTADLSGTWVGELQDDSGETYAGIGLELEDAGLSLSGTGVVGAGGETVFDGPITGRDRPDETVVELFGPDPRNDAWTWEITLSGTADEQVFSGTLVCMAGLEGDLQPCFESGSDEGSFELRREETGEGSS